MFCGTNPVGSVDGVYAEGASQVAEYIVVRWTSRNDEPVLVATKDVTNIEPRGVILMGEDPDQYITAPLFNPKSYPSLRRLH